MLCFVCRKMQLANHSIPQSLHCLKPLRDAAAALLDHHAVLECSHLHLLLLPAYSSIRCMTAGSSIRWVTTVTCNLPIACLSCSDHECVSASSDGSCIIWDLSACRRRQSLFANTFFLGVVYHPDESQIVTTGTDRKVRRMTW